MSRFLDVVDDYIFDPKKKKESNGKYIIEGSTQTRNGINFVENSFSAEVTYLENINSLPYKVQYTIDNLKQSNEGLIFQFAESFNEFTSQLDLYLNEDYHVLQIANHQEIVNQWLRKKIHLFEKFKQIPNIHQLLENYEKSIHNEEKLRNSIFYEGIAYIFFPKIKHLIKNSEKFPVRLSRTKYLNGYYFGLKIPIKEEITIKRNENQSYTFSIFGSLNESKIEDKTYFLKAFRMLYGEQVELKQISFKSVENYILNSNLEYRIGEIDHHFEVKNVHFKKDSLKYKFREDE
jgi:hypothetical protein